ncbi:MAG: DoxX family membrane protein [Candidatus Omnitrophica bacterium]|nr:DoxX family membrane protein [Candidatus Omnitrophota bacterium]MDD5671025.1 DoxX family membrane protein [Candidatus Omnitrophota bacterium]
MKFILRAVPVVARLSIGFIFAYSGFSKLLAPVENFRGALAAYEIFPSFTLPLIAQFFPWLELIFGVFLILGFASRWSALALAVFSLFFICSLSLSKIMTGVFPAECGCFGEGIHLKGRQVILLDSAILVIGVILFRIKKHWASLDQWLMKDQP